MAAAASGLLPGMGAPLLVGVPGLLLPFLLPRLPGVQPLGLVLAFFAVGGLSWNARHSQAPGDALSAYAVEHPDAVCELEGRVRAPQVLTPGRDYLRFALDVDTLRTGGRVHRLEGRTEVRWINPDRPVTADVRVRVRGTLSPILGTVNPGVSGYEDYLRRKGIHTAVSARGAWAVESRAPGRAWRPTCLASRLRQAEADRLAATVPAGVLPFIVAVWLGDQSQLGYEGYATFVESGTAHILSVSGVHMAIIFASLTFALRSVVPRRRVRAVVILATVWVYALMAGAQAACLRAALMISLYLASDLFDREPDAATALGLSAILLLLGNPDLLLDIGFQLSYLCIASILLYGEPLMARMEGMPYALRGSLATTFSAQVLSLPAAVYRFHMLPLVSPLSNLVIVPLLAAALWLSFAASTVAFVSVDVARLFGCALWPVVWGITALSDLAASFRQSRLTLVTPTPWAIALYGIAALSVLPLLRGSRHWRWALAVLVVSAASAWALWRPLFSPAEVTFLDVGHGDATFIRTPGGDTVLIDGGDRRDRFDQGQRTVAPFLRTAGVSRLDCVAATHPDRDHIGGLSYILDHFRVGTVLLPARDVPDERERPLLERCERQGVRVWRLRRGDAVQLRGARLVVLHPPEGWPAEHAGNNGSLVLRLEWDGPDVLLPGDAEAEAEAAVAGLACAAPILKVPHHGSETSSTEAFLEEVQARDAVVSTGGGRGREPVSPLILDRYKRCGTRIWRTDRHGGIRLTFDKTGYRIEGARIARGYPVVRE
jgi:competence protein ComEC